MTQKEFADEQIKELKELSSKTKDLLSDIGLQFFKESSNRIFVEGKKADNSPIGKYSTKPTLAGRNSFANKAGFDTIAGTPEKRRKLKWVTIEGDRHLFEVKGGYKKLRELSGLETGKVNLEFTGQFHGQYTFQVEGKTVYIGFVENQRYRPDDKKVKTKNKNLIDGLTKKYGDIFSPTPLELASADKIIANFVNTIIK